MVVGTNWFAEFFIGRFAFSLVLSDQLPRWALFYNRILILTLFDRLLSSVLLNGLTLYEGNSSIVINLESGFIWNYACRRQNRSSYEIELHRRQSRNPPFLYLIKLVNEENGTVKIPGGLYQELFTGDLRGLRSHKP